MQRAVAGEQDAISFLWRAWNPALLRFLAARRVADPEDLASAIWVELAAKLPSFQGDGEAFQRWLFTTAHRRLIDAGRKHSRQPETGVFVDRGVSADFQAYDDTEWALSLIRRLPDEQATAVTLRIMLDMDVATVSDVMGRSEGHVRVLTHRGLKKLGRHLEAQSPGRASTSAPADADTHTTIPLESTLAG